MRSVFKSGPKRKWVVWWKPRTISAQSTRPCEIELRGALVVFLIMKPIFQPGSKGRTLLSRTKILRKGSCRLCLDVAQDFGFKALVFPFRNECHRMI
ncbi:hypothetical protein CEXT_9571 [Caerostris extrusa]|uniref:Ribosomal protein S14 n=1 Tax=Caerostris extrusa TaxID=172846 RepID=A0AAV4YCM9_CAEEX|nr:hypothetical protein CEXT_9571 [Caerostris extrusa]